jgi:predicted nucleic acid-binding protein
VKEYLVDTNIPSELTREKTGARVAAFLRSTDKKQHILSVMTIGEICKGIATLPVSQRRTALQDWLDIDVRSWFAGRILPVTEVIAERWGHLAATARRFDLGSRGRRNCGNSPSSRPYPRHAQRQRLRGSRHRYLQSLGNIKPRKNMPNSTSLSMTGLTMPRL